MIPRNIIVTARARPDDWLAQLADANAGYKIHFFDDKSSRDLVATHFPGDTLAAYDKVLPKAYRADLFRYCVLQVLGGVYSDVLIPYSLPFAEMWDLEQDRVYLVCDKNRHAIQVAVMACNRGSRFMQLCQRRATLNILNNYYGDTPLSVSGPEMAWRCFREYTGQSRVRLGKIYPHTASQNPPVQIDFRIRKTRGKYRRDVAEAVFVDSKGKLVCPYKLNRDRGHRVDPDYYWKAWRQRRVYGETEASQRITENEDGDG